MQRNMRGENSFSSSEISCNLNHVIVDAGWYLLARIDIRNHHMLNIS